MNKKYWLRGGLILASIDLIGQVVLLSISYSMSLKLGAGQNSAALMSRIAEVYGAFSRNNIWTEIILLPSTLLKSVIAIFKYFGGEVIYLLVLVVTSIVGYFVIGSILGWLYGKLKK